MPVAEAPTRALTPIDAARARLSPAIFIDEHCWLRPPEGGAPERFRLWDFQYEVLDTIEEETRLIILKARQLGLSWLVLAYALWLCTFNHGQTVLIVNRNLDEAKRLLKRVRFMWERLPAELREPLSVDSTRELEFARMDSRVISLPATEDTGSGESATLVIVDEWAKISRASGILTAILPTLSAAGTTLVGISTAKGYHNHFARSWKRAVDGRSDFEPVFIPSSCHPDRDERWHERKRREFDTEREFLQEYPETDKDAFQLPGDAVFAEFDRGKHTLLNARVPKSQWPVWRGIDFGYHHSPVYWLEVQSKRHVHVFDELDGQKLTTEELAGEILERDRALGVKTGKVPAGVDPAGKARTSQSGTESDHAVLKAAGIRVEFHEPSIPSDRVKLIKRLLRQGRLTIDPERCPFLIEALEQAEWELAKVSGADGVVETFPKETYRKDGYYEHPLDALGYALIRIFPPKGRPAVGRGGKPTAAAALSGYGGREFG